MKEGKYLFCFLFCVAIDIASMNVWQLYSDPEAQNQAYLIGQSLSFACYISFIHLLSKYAFKITNSKAFFILKICAFNWLFFAISDFVDTVLKNQYTFSYFEYAGFVISIPLTLWEIKKKWAKTH